MVEQCVGGRTGVALGATDRVADTDDLAAVGDPAGQRHLMVVPAGCVGISGWSLVAHAGSSSAWANVVCVTNPVIRPLWSAACAAGILAVP